MKKLIVTMLSLAALVGVTWADDAVATAFDSESFATVGAKYPGENNATPLWTTANTETNSVVKESSADGSSGGLERTANYLAIEDSSAGGLVRAVDRTKLNTQTIYFDSIVKMTPADSVPEYDTGSTDKLIVFLWEQEKEVTPVTTPDDPQTDENEEVSSNGTVSTTNLVVLARGESEGTLTTNIIDNVKVNAGEWYRLVIKPYNADQYQVWISEGSTKGDMKQAKAGTVGEFYSLENATMISSVGFQGTGSLNQLAFYSQDPIEVSKMCLLKFTVDITADVSENKDTLGQSLCYSYNGTTISDEQSVTILGDGAATSLDVDLKNTSITMRVEVYDTVDNQEAYEIEGWTIGEKFTINEYSGRYYTQTLTLSEADAGTEKSVSIKLAQKTGEKYGFSITVADMTDVQWSADGSTWTAYTDGATAPAGTIQVKFKNADGVEKTVQLTVLADGSASLDLSTVTYDWADYLGTAQTDDMGTEEDASDDVIYYAIDDLDDLKKFLGGVNNAKIATADVTFKLMNDIPFGNGDTWAGVGFYDNLAFNGTFDGNGKTISNVTFADNSAIDTLDPNKYRGFFNMTRNATIKNLTVNGNGFVNGISSEDYGCSMIVGYGGSTTMIIGCTAKGTITGTHRVAGIAVNLYGSATSCTNEASLTSTTGRVGGIIANFGGGTVEDCVNKGAVTGTVAGDGVGGIIARHNEDNNTIKNCSNEGTVSVGGETTSNVGEIVGVFSDNGGTLMIEGTVTGASGKLAIGSIPANKSVDGLSFATVADNVATYVKEADLLKNGTEYLVTAANAAPTIELSAGQSIKFNTTLATIDATGITAAAGATLNEPTTANNVTTYSASAAAPTTGTLTITANDNCTITVTGKDSETTYKNGATVAIDTVLVVTRTPAQDYKLDNCSATEELTMTAAGLTITATVKAITYATLTIETVDNCTITVKQGENNVENGAKFDVDDSVQLTVTRVAAVGYELDGYAAEETITMTTDQTVNAAVKAKYPSYIPADDTDKQGKFDTWKTANASTATAEELASDTYKEAFLLNVAPDKVEEAKAAFKITSITVNADGSVNLGEPNPGEGKSYNGTVTIKASATVNGDYNLQQTDAAARFFKAVLE